MKFTTADNENDNWNGGNCATYIMFIIRVDGGTMDVSVLPSMHSNQKYLIPL